MSGIETALLRASQVASVKDAFMELIASGVVVFPCDSEKHPRINEWQKVESVSREQAQSWLEKWPELTIGLPCGANGLFVIDLDKPKNEGERGGEIEFNELCRRHGYEWQASTLCQRTGSGGIHLFYKMPSGRELRNSKRKLAPCIDTRGAGGFVIISPSIGSNGAYSWLNDLAIADLPEWLRELLLQGKPESPANPPKKPSEGFKAPGAYFGPYQNEREQRAYQAALEGESRNVAIAQEGVRNEQLNASAFALGRYVGAGKLDESEVRERLYSAAQTCGLQSPEIEKTLRSGLESGKLEPKEIAPHNGSWQSGPQSGQAIQKPEQGKQELEQYQAECNAKCLFGEFHDTANEFANTSAISTGFANLDRLLDGGLYPGLYVAGAITSLGKTTFCLQIADAIAKAGHDVLIFSLEMSKYELIAKSLSRLSILESEKKGSQISRGWTAREILAGQWCKQKILTEGGDIYRLWDFYNPIAQHLYIVEGDFAMSAKKVAVHIKRHIMITGNIPHICPAKGQKNSPKSQGYVL